MGNRTYFYYMRFIVFKNVHMNLEFDQFSAKIVSVRYSYLQCENFFKVCI